MIMRDRLKRLADDQGLVELFFAPGSNYYLAKLTYVGQDYLEFDAYDDEENVIAHNIMPMHLLTGVTTMSMERNREKFELLFNNEATPDGEKR